MFNGQFPATALHLHNINIYLYKYQIEFYFHSMFWFQGEAKLVRVCVRYCARTLWSLQINVYTFGFVSKNKFPILVFTISCTLFLYGSVWLWLIVTVSFVWIFVVFCSSYFIFSLFTKCTAKKAAFHVNWMCSPCTVYWVLGIRYLDGSVLLLLIVFRRFFFWSSILLFIYIYIFILMCISHHTQRFSMSVLFLFFWVFVRYSYIHGAVCVPLL